MNHAHMKDIADKVKPIECDLAWSGSLNWANDHELIVGADYGRISRIDLEDPLKSERVAGGSSPVLSPDGNYLAFTGGGALWLINMSTGEEECLSELLTGSGGPPVWTPDSQYLSFVRDSSHLIFPRELVMMRISDRMEFSIDRFYEYGGQIFVVDDKFLQHFKLTYTGPKGKFFYFPPI